MKKNKEKAVREKAMFSQRFMAFIIDILLALSISTVVLFPFNLLSVINDTNVSNTVEKNEVEETLTDLINDFQNSKIDMKTYFEKAMQINYRTAQGQIVSTIIIIIVDIIYFIVIPVITKGQTIGKKIMKIRVVNKDEDKKLTINNLVIRSFLVNSIFINILTLGFTIFANMRVYFWGVMIAETIQIFFMFVTMICVATRENGRGIHDIIADTFVIKENSIIKEELA